MGNLLFRLLKRIFKSSFYIYGPAFIIFTFAMILFQLFPTAPLWPIPVFAVFVITFFYRWFKW
ncbi:hypothetical protein CKF43_06995 [Pantoea graminicola]|nr:hypothetical protein CKF43_06995 [Pantoea sp. ARC607]